MKEVKWKVLKWLNLERTIWNIEWALGRWNVLDSVDPVSVELVRAHARKGTVIEFGCGSGTLIEKVGRNYYEKYTGIDISEKAIQRAIRRSIDSCTFKAGKMQDWAGEPAKLIIIREALYYLDPIEQKKLLDLCVSCTSPDGVVYVSAHDSIQFEKLLNQVRESGIVVEERRVASGPSEAVHLLITSKPT